MIWQWCKLLIYNDIIWFNWNLRTANGVVFYLSNILIVILITQNRRMAPWRHGSASLGMVASPPRPQLKFHEPSAQTTPEALAD